MKKIILSIVLLGSVISSKTACAQITFTTDKFSKTQTNLTDLEISKINDLGITFPIDDKINKYDKIVVTMYYKFLNNDAGNTDRYVSAVANYFPKQESFKDNYSSKMKIYLVTNSSDNNPVLSSKENFESASPKEFQITVDGYFLDGTETIWNEYREAFETRNVYAYSKKIYESSKITFIPDQKEVDRVKNRELVRERYAVYSNLHEELMEYITPVQRILSARCYYPIEHDIAEQLKQSNSDQNVDGINELIELESKYMEIFKNKETKELLKKIDKMTDFEERKKAVLEF